MRSNSVSYFLGANTASGFYSLYDSFTAEQAVEKVWLIKGGPGNGKSTFMRTVADAAEAAGMTVEYILCSGDPDSLDGIYIRETKTVYTDATSPHVQEPSLPGATGRYIDLTAFYREDIPWDEKSLAAGFARYREQYAAAYGYLHAAAAFSPELIPSLSGAEERTRLEEKARRFTRQLPATGSGHRVVKRFIGAYTCKGPMLLPALAESCGRVVRLESRCALADPFMRSVLAWAKRSGHPAILCPDPLTPEKLAGLLLPEAGVSLHAGEDPAPCAGSTLMALDDVISPEKRRKSRGELARLRSLRSSALKLAAGRLAEAKRYHDDLERLYAPHVDFAALSEFCAEHVRKNIGM